MHRLAALLLAVSALLLLAPPDAVAQEPPAIRLTLVSQTPWNGLKDRLLEVRVQAENTGTDPVEGLSLGVTLFGPVLTRTAYEESLSEDPTSAVIDAVTLPQTGAIAPGGTRTFGFRLDLSTVLGLDRTRSLVYPMRIDLRSGFTPLAAIRTPVIFLVRKPETPLDLSWTFVLDHPLDVRPDGVFASTALGDQLVRGSSLAGTIRALTRLVEGPSRAAVDVAISPLLVSQLARMRGGYRVVDGGSTRQVAAGKDGSALAAGALADLKAIANAAQVELSALPFAAPRIPALVANGLSRDLSTQLSRGREVLANVLGGSPDPSVLRPPDSAVDATSVDALAEQGVALLFVDPEVAPPPVQPQGFAPPPIADLAGIRSDLRAVVPDPSVEALLRSDLVSDDPVRAAHAVLGELAQIWLELPGTERGLALTFGEDLDPPGAFFGPLVRGVAEAPWLRKRRATVLASRFAPTGTTPATAYRAVPFSRSYVEAIKRARRDLGVYRSMLVQESSVPDELETQLLLAESGRFVLAETEGRAYIDAVEGAASRLFSGVRADTGPVNTLTSSSGKVFVPLINDNDVPVRVTVRLVSSHLRDLPSSTMVLDAGSTRTASFDVRLTTTGRFTVDVQIASPSGAVIRTAELIVRSTAYNRIALVITVGAALVALGIWARRFLPRRTS
ncbi:MAG: DUF6049 family protein [Candidatus Velamenicoccus archaeovorus]